MTVTLALDCVFESFPTIFLFAMCISTLFCLLVVVICKKKHINTLNRFEWAPPTYLFDQVPGEAMIGGELQAHLGIDVRGGLAAAAHDQRELQAVGGSDLHGLGLHVADAGAGAGLT